MNARLAALLLALAVAGAMAWYVDELRDDLQASQKDLATASQAAMDSQEVIRTLQATQRRNDLARKRLEATQAGIRTELASRETLIRTLQDENEQIRAWAAARLPGPVVRLREHGPIVGAAGYRQFLSGGAALPSAGSVGEDQR